MGNMVYCHASIKRFQLHALFLRLRAARGLAGASFVFQGRQCGGKAQKARCIPRFFTGFQIPLKKRSAAWMPREKRRSGGKLYSGLTAF